MKLANIHCHILYGVDDGAKDGKTMRQMIDSEYAGGVRLLCLTPHYNPAYFRCSPELIVTRYHEALQYASEKYPDMKLCLGQEIYCHHDPVEELLSGKCLTLGKTGNVLIEFGPHEDRKSIFSKTTRLLTSGFVPVIAHVERYASLRSAKTDIEELRDLGARIQVNAASVAGKSGFMTKRFVMSLIKSGLADIVADDCHDMAEKAPCLRDAYDTVKAKFGEDTAVRLFWKNPAGMLR